jgi:2-haloacid dehalogenase
MIRTVVFDLGGVLFDWNPRYLFRKLIPDEAALDDFLTHVCPFEWHINQDRGYSCEAATRERQALFPQHADLISAYYSRFDEMIAGAFAGTVDILTELHQQDVPLYALTNWPADTFHISGNYSFMSCFRGVVVSGYEFVMKPEPRIFRILLERYDIEPQSTLFIDDLARNVAAAEAQGLVGHVFTSAATLRQDLLVRGLLS